MKKFLRYFLYLILFVLLLAGGFALYIQISGIPKYDVEDIKFPQVVPDSASIALGTKIAAVQCVVCHTDSATGKLSGRLLWEVPSVFGELHSANITQSKEHGIGKWTDAQIVYFLRTGVKPNGQYVPIYMPKYPHMSDADIRGILSFLHSDNPVVQANENPAVPCKPSFLVKFLSHVEPGFKKIPYPTAAINEPDTADLKAYGKYLVTGRYDCYPCHSADFKKVNMMEPEKSLGFMGGGNSLLTRRGNIIYSANLTPDEKTGIGTWTVDDFREAMLHQKSKGGTHNLRAPMLMMNGLSELEIKAMYTYLMSLPKISTEVNRQYDKEDL